MNKKVASIDLLETGAVLYAPIIRKLIAGRAKIHEAVLAATSS
jgi:hypothetical protein